MEKAVQKIKKIFFPKDPVGASKWARRWNNYEKSRSAFIIYSIKPRKYIYFRFMFIIGTGDRLSILGEKRNYKDGMNLFNTLK